MSRPPQNGGPNGGYRNFSTTSSNPSAAPPPGQPMASQARQLSRAERFEDEKRRIIESCFSKTDQSGQLAESYITHIRVQEDAQYPNTPAPPESSPESKKPRLIIIAVRSTGRVRMHKARENNNGSFSIGKTWNLEELSAIETFSGNPHPPQTEREAQHRQWAGNVGFTVTITKSYYWQAGTAKEKEFFIASTVKIYRKYTKGQVPELKGFDENVKAQMLGALPGQQPPPTGPPPMGMQPQQPQDDFSEPPAPPQPPFAQRPQSRDDSRYRGSPGPPPSMSDSRGGSGPSSRHESPAPYGQGLASPPSVPKPFASSEQLRSNSREPYRDPQRDLRPGTAPGPGGYQRSPPPNVAQMPRAPSAHSSNSQPRPESPANLTLTSSRGEMPRALQAGPQSPRRQPGYQSMESERDERSIAKSPPTSMNGANGASLFQATQQRWQDQNQQRSQPPPQQYQLPPIETARFNANNRGHQPQQSMDRIPKSADTEISSPGMDAGDAAAFAALGGFMGPEHSFATAPQPTPVVNEPSSPPTPERSRKRPPIDQTHSDTDMRPAPLASRPTTALKKPSLDRPVDTSSITKAQGAPAVPAHVNSRSVDRSIDRPSASVTPKASSVGTPQTEEPPALSTARNDSDPTLNLPGAFIQSPGPSPLATPAEAPAKQPKEEEAAQQAGEEYRPGLGPMIKKKAVAERFKKAANAANAFKPRAGGAAEKIMKAKAEREANSEPDGITGVVPRPAHKPAAVVQEEVPSSTADLAVKEPVSREVPGQPPKVEISSPLSPARGNFVEGLGILDGATGKGLQLADEPDKRLSTPDAQARVEEEERARIEQREVRQPQVKIKRRSAQQKLYLSELGVDPSLLGDRGVEFEQLLYDFGWADASLSPKALGDLEANLRREQARLEAGAWLSNASQETQLREERERQVSSLLDKAVQECDEMDGLLTLYGVELSTLTDDISYIEAQSQGLQVQAANQRLLHTELTKLVETLSLDRRTFDPLRQANLADARGLEDAESNLVRVYEALVKIDPNIRSSSGRPKSRGDMNEGNELASMRAVRQKREEYGRESDRFCQRVMQQLDSSFNTSFNSIKGKVLLPAQTNSTMMKLNAEAFTEARRSLWMYSPLVLFTKELNRPAWQTMFRKYHDQAKPVYTDAFGQNVSYWKRCLRKPTGEEVELLFTHIEKDDTSSGSGSALSSARKLTVKRSQTLAKTLRSASGDKHHPSDSRNTGSMTHAEVFSGAVDEMAVLLSFEQNFIVDFFHATSLETADFMDVVAQTPIDQRYGTNLAQQKPLDPDRDMARQVTTIMSEIFAFFTNELSSLVDWSITPDPIQGVGVLACLTRHAFFLQDTSQEFLVQLIETLKGRLTKLFSKFVDDQVRAIEETKVKIKKRKGVIGFMKTFPHFAMAVENTFATVGRDDYDSNAACMYDTRVRLDDAYDRINGAMFDSLKVIAKEGPGATAPAPGMTKGGADDAEDKEMLNYHVLIIENMNHYISEVDDSGRQSVLTEWKGRAEVERKEAMDAYVSQVIRRPLGKLLDFLAPLPLTPPPSATQVQHLTTRPTHTRKSARTLFASYSPDTIRRGVEQLRSRIEKHFGHGDDEVKSRELVALVCKACEAEYERTLARCEEVVGTFYPSGVEGEKAVEIGFGRGDFAGFMR